LRSFSSNFDNTRVFGTKQIRLRYGQFTTYDLKEYDKAISDYHEAISLDPNYAAAYNNRGNRYYDWKDYDKAISDYSEAIRLDPNYASAYNNRGLAFRERGDIARARADFDKANQLGYTGSQ
jgi:tetratricopeptide (TPR) repeat protein